MSFNPENPFLTLLLYHRQDRTGPL